MERGNLRKSVNGDISCDRKGNKDECLANARVVKVFGRKFGVGQRSFIGPGSEKKCYSGEKNSPQGACDHITDEMLLEFAESGHPIFSAMTPLARGFPKSKGHGKLSSTNTSGSLESRICKEYTSYYRKLATKTVYVQKEELREY